MRKVLIVTYYWPPSGGAGVQRWLKFTKFLPDFGFVPYVVSVDPGSASYPVTDSSLEKDIHPLVSVTRTKSTEPFGFYKLFTRRKQIPFAGFANERKEKFSQKVFRFIRGNFFIPDARKGWNSHALKACIEIIEKEKIDLVITSSPPHSTQLIGRALKKRYPALKWIADLRDPWTDIYYYNKLLHTPIASAIDKHYERKVIEECDQAIVVSEYIKKQFLQKTPLALEEKIHVIPNGYDDEDFSGWDIEKEEEFLITYTGTVSPEYPVQEFASAFRKVSATHPVRIRFVGSVPGVVKEMFNGLKAEFVSHVDHRTAIRFMLQSNALLLMIPNAKGNEGILTGKLFEYLASHTPVLFIGPTNGDAAEIIKSSNAGIVVSPGNVDQISVKLIELIESWKSIKSDNIERFSRKQLTKKLSEILSGLGSGKDNKGR